MLWGWGGPLSQALPYRGPGEAVFDRGAVFTQMALVAAGGGEACSDIEALRAEPEVFGAVQSASTVRRGVHRHGRRAGRRCRVSGGSGAPDGVAHDGHHPRHPRGLDLDTDASFHVVHL